MRMSEIQERVMFQTVNDIDDIGDFLPHLDGYINAGYDLLFFCSSRRTPRTDAQFRQGRTGPPGMDARSDC